jgi:hypothetical protein
MIDLKVLGIELSIKACNMDLIMNSKSLRIANNKPALLIRLLLMKIHNLESN